MPAGLTLRVAPGIGNIRKLNIAHLYQARIDKMQYKHGEVIQLLFNPASCGLTNEVS
jgi:hypothetical protein